MGDTALFQVQHQVSCPLCHFLSCPLVLYAYVCMGPLLSRLSAFLSFLYLSLSPWLVLSLTIFFPLSDWLSLGLAGPHQSAARLRPRRAHMAHIQLRFSTGYKSANSGLLLGAHRPLNHCSHARLECLAGHPAIGRAGADND